MTDEVEVSNEEKFHIWSNFIVGERLTYIEGCKRDIGYEYEANRKDWDYLFERDWVLMEERLRSGIGVPKHIRDLIGNEYFKRVEIVDTNIESMLEEVETYQKEEETLRIYTYEDFIMLSNQGIFRDEIFIIDPQRRWKKKVKESIIDYGFSQIEIIEIAGGVYFVVSR
tara:strand:- start:41233 stop:41739 length:507 start_codon:yes stop_codon:yes gene_type:complete